MINKNYLQYLVYKMRYRLKKIRLTPIQYPLLLQKTAHNGRQEGGLGPK